MHDRIAAVLVAALLLASAPQASAEPWAKGGPLPAIALEDQHGKPHEVGRALRLVLVSYDMDGGRLVRETLDAERPSLLDEAGAVYVANVARMPGFVTRMFALPRMRKRPYPVLLDRDGVLTAPLVGAPGHAVAVRAEAGTIVEVTPLSSTAAVRRALGLEQGEPRSAP